jgi:hypothetical protein
MDGLDQIVGKVSCRACNRREGGPVLIAVVQRASTEPWNLTEARSLARKRIRSKAYRIFLSHASKDKWIARQMLKLLERDGTSPPVEVFLDERTIQAGDDIPDEIRDAIGESDELLVLLTPHSLGRPWVLMEVGAAWQLKKRIVPITYNVLAEDLPGNLRNAKAMELNEFDECARQLLARARKAG